VEEEERKEGRNSKRIFVTTFPNNLLFLHSFSTWLLFTTAPVSSTKPLLTLSVGAAPSVENRAA
jgi:hypothetical protein